MKRVPYFGTITNIKYGKPQSYIEFQLKEFSMIPEFRKLIISVIKPCYGNNINKWINDMVQLSKKKKVLPPPPFTPALKKELKMLIKSAPPGKINESVNEVRKLYAKKIQSASNSTSARSSIRAVIARNQKNAKSASPTSVLHEMAY